MIDSWPRRIQEILVRPNLDDFEHDEMVDSLDDIQYLDWIMAMKLKSLRISNDDKYVIGVKQSGHQRMVARLYSLSKEKQTMSNTIVPFGAQMHNARKNKGITGVQLASNLNIARSHLYAIENGEIKNPSVDLAHRICRELDIPRAFSVGTNELRFKQLTANAKLPTKAHDIDSGMDLYASHIIKNNSECVWFGTGIAVEIPVGFSGFIFPRSSISKIPLTLANSVGVIDPGYRGEIQVRFNRATYRGAKRVYTIGDRVAQLIIVQVPNFKPVWADELEDSERGVMGFGSSGN